MKALKPSSKRNASLMSGEIETKNVPSFIDSRFGRIRVNMEKAVHFPSGLLGMPDKTHFCLADFPDPLFGQFKVLQSLEDESLSFIVLPLDEDDDHPSFFFIEKKDIDTASAALGIGRENIAILLIASIHNVIDTEEVKVSVNVRAPLIVDTEDNLGTQFVFQSNKYQIRKMLN